ncbi:MAG: hypothetical protein K2W96_03100, partial [Gemmataceae bacterium]|nr:hypothetical protein [Gemmataceae bacterium]
HNGDVGINVLVLAPLALLCLWTLGKGLSSLGGALAMADYERNPPARPQEAWSKEQKEAAAGVAFGPKGEALAHVGGKTLAWDEDGKPLPEQAWPRFAVSAAVREYGSGRRELKLEAFGAVLEVEGASDTIRASVGGKAMQLKGHKGKVECLALSADGKLALSGGEDRTVRLWDLEKGAQKGSMEGHQGAVARVLFLPDGARAVSSGRYPDRRLIVWDLGSMKEKLAFAPRKEDVPSDLGLSADGRRAFVRYATGCLAADLETGEKAADWGDGLSFADHLALSADGKRALKAWGKRVAMVSMP